MKRVVAAALVAAVPACTLLVDTSDLLDRAPGPPDAETPDVVAPESAAPDAAAEAEGGGPFCGDAGHSFCADFDSVVEPESGWSSVLLDAPATLSLSTARAVSGAASVRVDQPRLPSGGSGKYALLTQEFPGPHRHVVLVFDMYMEEPDWMASDVNAAFAYIEYYADGVAPSPIFVVVGSDYTDLTAFGAYAPTGKAFPMNRWVHVEIDADPVASVTMTMDGEGSTVPVTSPPTGAAPGMVLHIGVTGYNAPAPRFVVHYDNIALDFR